jgi:norsolorinic acid ketoreductase
MPSPGFVDTDMGRTGAARFGTTVEALGAISPEESASKMLRIIYEATKESRGGRFWDENGKELQF